MAWVKIDDHFDDNPELEDLSCEAVTLFICATTWCARHESDGEIPEKTFRKLKGFSKKSCAELCAGDKPWIQKKDGGFIVRNFLKYNPSKEQIEAEREATRLRVTGFRSKKKQECNGVTDTVTTTVSNAVSNTAPVPVPNNTPTSLRSVGVTPAQENEDPPTYSEAVQKAADKWIEHLMQTQTRYRQIMPSERKAILDRLADPENGDPMQNVLFSMSKPNNTTLLIEWRGKKQGKQNMQGVYQEAMAALEEMSQ